MKNDLQQSEFNNFIIGRAKSQLGIDTQIDRMADEFPKNERSGGNSRVRKRGYRDDEEVAEMAQGEKTLLAWKRIQL